MTELQMISKLSESEQQSPTTLTSVRVKTPRRILHFSDGIMEEYSSDDEVDGANKCDKVTISNIGFAYVCVSMTHTFDFFFVITQGMTLLLVYLTSNCIVIEYSS